MLPLLKILERPLLASWKILFFQGMPVVLKIDSTYFLRH